MKKFLAAAVFTAMFAATNANGQTDVWDGSHTTWTNGAGTQSNPYLIENAEQLAHLAYVVNNGIGSGSGEIVGAGQYWKLTTNINLNGSQSFQWNPIGLPYFNYYFGGNFDGNGHTISNLFVDNWVSGGLFAKAFGATIKNLGIIGNSSIISSNNSEIGRAHV
jgi:hypothetical protein